MRLDLCSGVMHRIGSALLERVVPVVLGLGVRSGVRGDRVMVDLEDAHSLHVFLAQE